MKQDRCKTEEWETIRKFLIKKLLASREVQFKQEVESKDD